MNLLEEFCRQIGLRTPMDVEDIDYKIDLTDFNSVDGEEGDNGIIRYYDLEDGELLAIKTVHGGDDEDIEFTHLGRDILQDKALDVFYDNIESSIS